MIARILHGLLAVFGLFGALVMGYAAIAPYAMVLTEAQELIFRFGFLIAALVYIHVIATGLAGLVSRD